MVVDTSGAVEYSWNGGQAGNFAIERGFFSSVISSLPDAQVGVSNGVNIGIASYSSTASIDVSLSSMLTRADALDAMDNLAYPGLGSNLTAALAAARWEITSSGRSQATVVVVTHIGSHLNTALLQVRVDVFASICFVCVHCACVLLSVSFRSHSITALFACTLKVSYFTPVVHCSAVTTRVSETQVPIERTHSSCALLCRHHTGFRDTSTDRTDTPSSSIAHSLVRLLAFPFLFCLHARTG
jgi:hypothetical protein